MEQLIIEWIFGLESGNRFGNVMSKERKFLCDFRVLLTKL